MCYYTQLVKNPKYRKNQKNGGCPPPVPDGRVEYIPASCGKCQECKKQKANGWRVRLFEDIKQNKNGKFITLTLSNESIQHICQQETTTTDRKTGKLIKITIGDLRGYDKDNQIATYAMRMFNERWRQLFKEAIRHWTVTELGHQGTENIHLHGIIWTDQPNWIIEWKWKYGFIWCGYKINGRIQNYVNMKTINYVVKYITKTDQRNKEYNPIVLTSPSIGECFLNTYQAQQIYLEKREYYTSDTGHKMTLPTYYKNKIFNDNQREILWLNRLDKGERWIGGEKVTPDTTPKQFEELLRFHRKRNHELGYGGRTNENRKEQEEIRREMLIMKRIAKANTTPSAGSIQKGMDIYNLQQETQIQTKPTTMENDINTNEHENSILKHYQNKFRKKE